MSVLVITAPVNRSAAAADAGVDVSGVVNGSNAADWTLVLTVYGPATTTTDARIAIQDVAAADFTTPHYGPIKMIGIGAGTGCNRQTSYRKRDWFRMNIGVATAKLRTNLLEINNGAITYGLILRW